MGDVDKMRASECARDGCNKAPRDEMAGLCQEHWLESKPERRGAERRDLGDCAGEDCYEQATARAPGTDVYYCNACWDSHATAGWQLSKCKGCGSTLVNVTTMPGAPLKFRCMNCNVPPLNPLKRHDLIDDPQHYGGRDNPYEAIKVMLAWHGRGPTRWFCQLTAEKYLCRAGKKVTQSIPSDDEIRDLRKAAWYATAAADIIEHGKVRA